MKSKPLKPYIKKPTERDVLNACLQWLAVNGYFVWRNNTGGYKINDGAGRFIRYGAKGSPDIIGMTKQGQFLGIECKAGRNKQEPEQIEFEAKIKASGGIYILAYSVDDLIKSLL